MSALQVDQVRQEIIEMIQENSAIGDMSKVLVNVSQVGPFFKRKPHVQLEGTVDRDIFREKLERQIAEKYDEAVELSNELKVQSN